QFGRELRSQPCRRLRYLNTGAVGLKTKGSDILVEEDAIRQVVIEDTIKRELEMLSTAEMISPSQIREGLETFAKLRWVSLAVLSTHTIKSCHGDWLNAEREEKNLVGLRFGRFNNLIGCLNLSLLIDHIMEIETKWVKEFSEENPEFAADDSNLGETFYLRCELETYSDETLSFYYNDVLALNSLGQNLMKERWTLMKSL
ncbi:MAG: DUF4125 family protein, partial [Chloroflexota bacterium]|nr:DUF4125 family protein [Chloroflexota bacterium]